MWQRGLPVEEFPGIPQRLESSAALHRGGSAHLPDSNRSTYLSLQECIIEMQVYLLHHNGVLDLGRGSMARRLRHNRVTVFLLAPPQELNQFFGRQTLLL